MRYKLTVIPGQKYAVVEDEYKYAKRLDRILFFTSNGNQYTLLLNSYGVKVDGIDTWLKELPYLEFELPELKKKLKLKEDFFKKEVAFYMTNPRDRGEDEYVTLFISTSLLAIAVGDEQQYDKSYDYQYEIRKGHTLKDDFGHTLKVEIHSRFVDKGWWTRVKHETEDLMKKLGTTNTDFERWLKQILKHHKIVPREGKEIDAPRSGNEF